MQSKQALSAPCRDGAGGAAGAQRKHTDGEEGRLSVLHGDTENAPRGQPCHPHSSSGVGDPHTALSAHLLPLRVGLNGKLPGKEAERGFWRALHRLGSPHPPPPGIPKSKRIQKLRQNPPEGAGSQPPGRQPRQPGAPLPKGVPSPGDAGQPLPAASLRCHSWRSSAQFTSKTG